MRVFTLLFAVLSAATAAIAQGTSYDELYRPGFHFSPAVNWTNEPHGMIYLDGRYHMFYQHNPDAPVFDVSKASWGHAVSTDLVHWEHKPVALPVENGISSFTGSAVFDPNNTSGLGSPSNPPLVLAYTGFNFGSGVQDQRLAYSTDSGESFTKFSGNPVLQDPVNPFEARDPKVFWHEDTSAWKMVLAHGGQNRLSIWDSPDLKSWTFKSNFTDNVVAASGVTGWEVPDLVELPIDGDPNDKRWVMIWTPAQGSPAGGNGVTYAVGADTPSDGFDGTHFVREQSGTALWADYGRDFDGTQSWNNIPESNGRVIHTGIMQAYGNDVPTFPWRGQFAAPRELGLTQTPTGLRLTQNPIEELEAIRSEQATLSNVNLTPGFHSLADHGIEGEMLDLVATFDPGTASEFGLRVRSGGAQHTDIGYVVNDGKMYIDRRDSGRDDFTPGFAAVHEAPLALDNGLVKLRMLVDRSTIEVFGGRGESVISDLIFPDPTSTGVAAYSFGGSSTLVSLEAYGMNDIWNEAPVPPTTQTIGHWSMDAAGVGAAPGGNPATFDVATLFGQGTAKGPNSPLHPRTEARDDLWMFNSRQEIGGSPDQYVTRLETAPASMYGPGFSGGSASYDAGAIAGVNGALFFPADVYGNEFNFNDSFSIEMVFRTDGDQTTAGAMQLLSQGENAFRYGLTLNEGGAGGIQFTIADKFGVETVLDTSAATDRSFADGQWHYLLATFDAEAGANGKLALNVVSEDGATENASLLLEASFAGLSEAADGNLFVGRKTFAQSAEPRTLLGLIDELRLSRGVVGVEEAIGALPPPLAGDYNDDGAVDAADYTVWRNHLGAPAGTLPNDVDGGVIGSAHYATWRANYGNSANAASATIRGAATPEPNTCLLALVVGLLVLYRR